MSDVSAARRKCLKNGKDVSASFRETEERVRQTREKLEELMKKLDDINQASLPPQRYRGQLDYIKQESLAHQRYRVQLEEQSKHGKDVLASYRETEERVRQAREKLEEELMKKLDDIKQASLAHQRYRGLLDDINQASLPPQRYRGQLDYIKQESLAHQRYRVQLEEQSKRRIDNARIRNKLLETQSAVYERRRQILEAEMDQRGALLRKLERVAKLEAEKSAQRNAMRLAFGIVSPPRLDESYGMSNSQSTVNLVLPVNVNTTPTSRRSNQNFNGTYRTSTQPSPNCQDVTLTNSVSVSPCRQQLDLLTGDDGSQDNARNECAVCYDNLIDSVLYTCGHMCMCHNCAVQQWFGEGAGHCPICRAVIHNVIRVYKSDDGSQDNARNECAVCYANPIDSVLYTCGHMCMCHNCAAQQWLGEGAGHCPICRAVIHNVIRVYKS